LLGCEGKPAPASASPDPATSGAPATSPVPSAAPTPSVVASPPKPADAAVPRVIPLPDTSCATDADCTMTDQELIDAPPNNYACCPGCTNHPGNKTWKMLFDAACKATPAPMCPPIGCAMPIQKVQCVAKKCVLK
jgi:hypothetical protein